jgi:hypothetical protein
MILAHGVIVQSSISSLVVLISSDDNDEHVIIIKIQLITGRPRIIISNNLRDSPKSVNNQQYLFFIFLDSIP